MAISGRKPTPVALRLITGNPGKRPLPTPKLEQHPGGPIERPKGLRGNASKLWDQFIARAHWLTWADGPKAMMWCRLQTEYLADPKMIASRIAQLRALGNELGFDVSSRDRMGITLTTGPVPERTPDGGSKVPGNPADKYLG